MKHSFPVIKDRKIRIALVGCGRISANHFGAILQYPDEFELVAVCDNDTSALDKATGEYKVPGYASLTELLQKEELDAVSICTPSGLHPD
jgi:UDP-N-acetyl-2-amino-2-deoxyglucuronate dehydrogenase